MQANSARVEAYLISLLSESNWLRRLWYGGACYDPGARLGSPPHAIKEVQFSMTDTKLKYMREFVLDLYVANVLRTSSVAPHTDVLRRQILIQILTQSLNLIKIVHMDDI